MNTRELPTRPLRTRLRAYVFAASCALLGSQAANATTFERLTTQDFFIRAELIAETEVLRVDYKSSDVAGPEHVRLPHTFVTLHVMRVLKGVAAAGDVITLRMLGGPTDDRSRTLTVSGIPTFRPGDRDVLFIRGNGTDQCPLVNWEQGRLRIVRNQVFDDFGRELWIDPSGGFVFGDKRIDVASLPYLPLPENPAVAEHDGSGGDSQPLRFEPPAGSVNPDSNAFADAAREMIISLAAANRLGALSPVASARLSEPFFVQALLPVAPAADPAAAETLARKRRAPPAPKQPHESSGH